MHKILEMLDSILVESIDSFIDIGKHIGNPQLGNRSLPLSALAESITTWGAGQGGQGAGEGFSLRSCLNALSQKAPTRSSLFVS